MEVPVTLFRVYLGMVTSFWSTFVLGGGGGGNVTFLDIQDPAGMFCSDIGPVLMGLSRMWRDRLSRKHRVVCSRVPPRRSWRERR